MTAVQQATRSFDRRLVAPLVVGATFNPVNSSIIAVSLVPIGVAFGAPASQTALLVSALYFATAVGQPVVGRLIDLWGPRRLFLLGSALTLAAGLLGALAPAFWVLLVARVLLGFGTCAGYPAAMHLIRSEATRTGHDSPAGILTALAVAGQTTAAVGPTVGGLLIGLGGWRLTLAVNVPLGLLGLALGAWRLPRTTALEPTGDRAVDVAGIALFTGTLVALLAFLVAPHVHLLWLLAVVALLAGAFVRRELRAAGPFVDLRLLSGNPPLVRTYARTFLAQLAAYAFLYGYSPWLEEGRGLSASRAGLLLLPTFVVGIVVSTLTGRRPEIRAKLVVGSVAQLVAFVLVLFVDGRSPIGYLVTVGCVLGVAQGLNNLANQNAVYHQADPERTASSAGLLRTFVYLGAIGASALGGVFFGARADTHGLHELAAAMLVAASLCLVLTLADRALGAVGHPRKP